MIGCERADALIERRLDGEASPEDDALLEAHVAGCPACAAQLAAETALDAALAARLGGAMPPPGFAAAVRSRVAAERPAAGAWIADALNAAGVLLVLLATVPVAMGWGGVAGIVLSTAALAAGLYPLLLAMWVHDTGSGQPDPAS